MVYLLLIVVAAALIYVAMRASRTQGKRSTTRVIGPDDDPDFLRRLGDNKPR